MIATSTTVVLGLLSLAAAQSNATTDTYVVPATSQSSRIDNVISAMSNSGTSPNATASHPPTVTNTVIPVPMTPIIATSESSLTTPSSNPKIPVTGHSQSSLQTFTYQPSSSSFVYQPPTSSSFVYEPTSTSFQYEPTTATYPPGIMKPTTEHHEQSLDTPSTLTSDYFNYAPPQPSPATVKSETKFEMPTFAYQPAPALVSTIPVMPVPASLSRVPEESRPAPNVSAEHKANPPPADSSMPTSAPPAAGVATDAASAMTAGLQEIWDTPNGDVMLGSYTLKPGTAVEVATSRGSAIPAHEEPSAVVQQPSATSQAPEVATTLVTAASPSVYPDAEVPHTVALNGHTVTVSSQSVQTGHMLTYQGQTLSMSGMTLAAEPNPRPTPTQTAQGSPNGTPYDEPKIVDSGVAMCRVAVGSLLIAIAVPLLGQCAMSGC